MQDLRLCAHPSPCAALVEWANTLVTAIQKELKNDEMSQLMSEIEEAIQMQEAEKAATADEDASRPVQPPTGTWIILRHLASRYFSQQIWSSMEPDIASGL